MIIYIAGKITGEPLPECKAKFEEAESRLRQPGVRVINPFKLGIPETATPQEAMPHYLKALRQCTAIFMLEDWRQSPEALVEHNHAEKWKLDIYYEEIGDYNTVAGHINAAMPG